MARPGQIPPQGLGLHPPSPPLQYLNSMIFLTGFVPERRTLRKSTDLFPLGYSSLLLTYIQLSNNHTIMQNMRVYLRGYGVIVLLWERKDKAIFVCKHKCVLNSFFSATQRYNFPGRKGTLDCLLHQFLKSYNNVHLFIGLTNLGSFN